MPAGGRLVGYNMLNTVQQAPSCASANGTPPCCSAAGNRPEPSRPDQRGGQNRPSGRFVVMRSSAVEWSSRADDRSDVVQDYWRSRPLW